MTPRYRPRWRYLAHRTGLLCSPLLFHGVPFSNRWHRRRIADRDLARLARTTGAPAVTIANDEQRDPDYCWTCGRKCGSQAH